MSDTLTAHATWCRRQALEARKAIELLPPEDRTAALVGGRLALDAALWVQLADETDAYLDERRSAGETTSLF